MITLSLFRHAKSAWDQPGLRDFDRALAPRGEDAAPRMGGFIAGNGLEPQIILCSTARRARQTLERALPEFAAQPELRFTDKLYHAGPGQMLGLIRNLPETCSHAMLVGHNPGMHALAMDLIADGDAASIAKLSKKYPTAGLAVIDFDGGWRDVADGSGTLRQFVTPKDLT